MQIGLPGSNGIKIQLIKLIKRDKNGLIKKRFLLDLLGIITSFKINFKPSANG